VPEYPTTILDLEVTPELKQEGLAREVIRHVQQARKQAGLEVDDRIDLSLTSDDEELTMLLKNNSNLTDVIQHETLTTSFNKHDKYAHNVTVKIEGSELAIGLSKAKQ
jgi:isoleucyl-tRNA synthetase